MQKIFRYILVSFAIILLANTLYAQEDDINSYAIYMISRATHDSILLRWAPVNYDSWKLGINNGYFVERFTLYKDDKPYPDRTPVKLNDAPLKPISLDAWEKMSEKNDYAGIAAQAIYGEDFEIEADGESTVISMFNRATEQQNRYSFAMFAADYSADVAKGMGLMFVDRNVILGEKYLYIVYFANTDTLMVDTAFTFTGPDETKPLHKPYITQIVGGNKLATLEWQSPAGRSGYTSFDVQRSDDDGKTFRTLNTSPLVNTYEDERFSELSFYIDTLPVNNKKYVYRVRGINPFGEKGPFSDTVSVQGKDRIGEMPHISKHETTIEGVVIEWEFGKKYEKLIQGFKVMRSIKSDRDFQPVSEMLQKDCRTFIDSEPISTAYYKVHAIGKNNELAPSFPVMVQLVDSIPPAAPARLEASIDTTGRVFLHWKPNTEEDIYGYRIYRANSAGDEFSQLTVEPVPDTFYLDQVKIKTLTKKVYYRVMAIDQRQNYSAFSDILEVSRPDVIPPVPPVIKNVYSSEKGVCLEWVPSSSDDVISQVILRKSKNNIWEEIYKVMDTVTSYCDSTAKAGEIYEYTLAAYDETGLQSKIEQVVSGKKKEKGKSIELNCKVNRTGHHIRLTWNPVMNEGKYIIYRGINGASPMTYVVLEPANNEYIDEKITPQQTYSYIIKHIGGKSLEISNQVTVKF